MLLLQKHGRHLDWRIRRRQRLRGIEVAQQGGKPSGDVGHWLDSFAQLVEKFKYRGRGPISGLVRQLSFKIVDEDVTSAFRVPDNAFSGVGAVSEERRCHP